jgi:hypothetical protein
MLMTFFRSSASLRELLHGVVFWVVQFFGGFGVGFGGFVVGFGSGFLVGLTAMSLWAVCPLLCVILAPFTDAVNTAPCTCVLTD